MRSITIIALVALLQTTTPGTACAAERQPWITSRIVGTPDPPLRLTAERVFGSLTFDQPVDMAYLPGTDWIYVMELNGKIFAFDASLEDPRPQLVFESRAHFEQHNHSYGITFHPQVADNRYVYLSWTVPGQMVEDGTSVSRFVLSDEQPPQILAESRTDIIRWPSGGHNGACLKFGPDGCLYISTGDGVGPFPPDAEQTGQDLSDLRATILRIDVDQTSGERPYGIPADNPFVDRPEARGEIWAYGFRNPWKMSFSPGTGELLTGDVGWELWEMVYRVERGGNYGWSVMEGRQPVRSDVPRGPTPILPPLRDHHHIEARSITGGYVYRGSRLAELQGAYIYGDYVTGKIWGLRHEGNRVSWQEELADTSLAIITFGESRQGELYVVDYAGGLYRLRPNPQFGQTSEFPRALSQTGLFADVARQIPAPGVVAYSLLAEPWMDGARAQRFVALPEETSIVSGPNRETWVYPSGTVFAKTIRLDTDDNIRTPRKLETQIQHFDGEAWSPYTYIWNEQQTDALLAPAEGAETRVTIAGEEWTWRIHSRAECNTCHTPRAGFALGFFPQNLQAPSASASDQLADLVEQAVFESAFKPRDLKAPIVDPYAAGSDIDLRARSYLMVNCAHCHRRGGGGTAAIELPIEKPLDQTNAIDAVPTQGAFDIPQARIIAPGDPCRSVLFYRMASVGRGHMPHLGSRRVDAAGLNLIRDWIAQLPDQSATKLPDALARRRRDEMLTAEQLTSDAAAQLEHGSVSDPVDDLLKSTTGALELVAAIDRQDLTDDRAHSLIERGAAHENVIVRGLFERYLPEAQRSRRLGTVVDAAQILAIDGDVARGRELFAAASGVQCRNCHQIGQTGKLVGPELDDVGRRLSREQILQSILEPSRQIDARWVGQTLVTTDGRVLTGVLRERSAEQVVLRDNEGTDHVIATAQIEELVAQQKSLMPELLVQDLTAEQLADLLSYLASLTTGTAAP